MKKLQYIWILCLTISMSKAQNINFKKLERAVLEAGTLHRVDSFPSQNIVPRPVDVWLPENYSKDKRYAVLYMHDGQNLFDSTTTWNKQEWKVDEWVTKLTREDKIKDIIVVGIHNIPKIRWQDLYPEKALDYMPKKVRDSLMTMAKSSGINLDMRGDQYLKFLVNELKPIIDEQFSTLKSKQNTYVAGSSMGGLMSMYSVAEYPEVFAGGACFSTHWPGAIPASNNPHPAAIFDYMKDKMPQAGSHKLYFDYGNKTLDQYYPKFSPQLDTLMRAKGYTENDYINLFFEGADHSEKSWNKRLDVALLFLFGK